MGLLKSSIAVEENGLVNSHFFTSKRIGWDEISHVYAEKVDKITYDEIFIIVQAGQEYLSIGEMDDDFRSVEIGLQENLPNFPVDWQSSVEIGEAGARTQIWSRQV